MCGEQDRRQATGKRSGQPARLVEGQRVRCCREALNELDTAYPTGAVVYPNQLRYKQVNQIIQKS